MSIKGFHILFITIATLLCVFVALWAFVLETSTSLGLQVFGGSCALAAVVLPLYGVSFYRKAQKI
ncbi:hypothetical protein JIN77_13255 [Verrucomicrobiaceae bacterium R5-34]|uniref:Uncharacterized protein n=1 Tax=Oceaniferula flava TaxID=2800421 RepID=A0AAE2S9S7_9BACT|nr:hypothetical protein [Oceaniferula flavus]MBK1831697.1 hypothetical protein [Verrucomicrobiaceae bacterium R5-34]MBK1853966.1 hypothetical protein [Oceaniferula flavus]MBM1135272.1 hypothetical protein [Oceaniferula flavus]